MATRTFARRSALAAGLAGIGAVFLTSAVLTAITNELWFLRIVITDGPPPRVDELLLLKWFAGSFVAARLGAKRAVVVIGLYALAVAALTVLRFAIEPPLQCAFVPRPDCSTSALGWITGTPWVAEGLRGQIWILPGLLLGVLAARMGRVRIPLRPGLAALSVFAIGIVVANYLTWVARYTVCVSSDFSARCIDPEYLFWFATHIALGVAASMMLIRLGGTRRDALILGGMLSLAYLPAPVHQAALIWGDGIPAVLGNSGALAGVLTFVLLSLRAHSGRGYHWRSGRVQRDGTPPMEPSASGAPRVIRTRSPPAQRRSLPWSGSRRSLVSSGASLKAASALFGCCPGGVQGPSDERRFRHHSLSFDRRRWVALRPPLTRQTAARGIGMSGRATARRPESWLPLPPPASQ